HAGGSSPRAAHVLHSFPAGGVRRSTEGTLGPRSKIRLLHPRTYGARARHNSSASSGDRTGAPSRCHSWPGSKTSHRAAFPPHLRSGAKQLPHSRTRSSRTSYLETQVRAKDAEGSLLRQRCARAGLVQGRAGVPPHDTPVKGHFHHL